MRLVKGEGSPDIGACWMSAINWYMAEGREGFSWSDHPDCVPPTIRTLCIRLNDICKDGEREDLIAPHLFTPVGCDQSEAVEQERAYLCADRAMRVFAPLALDAAGLCREAQRLRGLTPVRDAESAAWAAYAAWAAWAAYADARTATDAADARTATDAADAADAAEAAAARAARNAAADAAEAAAEAAADAAEAAADTAARAAARREHLDLILDCCAVGERRGEQPAHTKDETLRAVCGVGADDE